MSKGWICLHREIMDKAIWQTSTAEQKTILVTLLMMANHTKKEWEWKGKKFICEPGQFITSLESIARKSGKDISIKNVRTALNKFEKYDFLANESTKTGRLITIVNWDKYQVYIPEGGNDDGKRVANGWQRGGKEVATNNNNNNENNENNDNNSYSSCPSSDEPDDISESIASEMVSIMKSVKPDCKTPSSLKSWAKSIDRIIRLDGKTPEQIIELFTWAQHDSFWTANIRSPDKLRAKWDQLEINMQRQNREKAGSQRNPTLEAINELYNKARREERYEEVGSGCAIGNDRLSLPFYEGSVTTDD